VVFKHVAKWFEVQERLTNQYWIWWIPEWIIFGIKVWEFSFIEELFKYFFDNEKPILKLVNAPLVNIIILVIIDLD
jgi:hypothetical protein